MSENINNVIPVSVNVKSRGLGLTNFGIPCFFYADATDPLEQGFNTFSSPEDVSEKFPAKTELIAAVGAWFANGGGTVLTYGYDETGGAPPAAAKVEPAKVALEDSPQAKNLKTLQKRLASIPNKAAANSFLTALQAAAIKKWFYWPFLVQTTAKPVGSELSGIADWCEANTRYLMWSTGEDDALSSSITTDDGSVLYTAGNRRSACCYSKISPYLNVKAAALLSRVDYNAINSYLDLNYKSVNQGEDDLDGTDIATLKAKNYFYNVEIASKGSHTGAMLQNTVSNSQFKETISEVVATDAYAITLQTETLNSITSQNNVPQTPSGQQLPINAADQLGERFIDNGFLGQRSITHPVSFEPFITRGYITITKAEDVYKLTDTERADHKLYPITQYIYRSGSAWTVSITINVS